jgi:hypothetical protein
MIPRGAPALLAFWLLASSAGGATEAGSEDVVVEISDGLFTLTSRDAPRLRLLGRLARVAGVQVVAGRLDPGRVDLQLRDATLEDALRTVLQGVPYALRYEVLPKEGRHVLALVMVGDFDEGRLERRRLRAVQRWRTQRRNIARRSALESALAHEDPDVRAGAARAFPVGPRSIQKLETLLTRDPAPKVRVEAARRLAFVDPPVARPLLVRALSDPEAAVLAAAIAGLALVGDASVVPQLKVLLSHPDAAVREGAARTVALLEESDSGAVPD